MVRVFRRPNNTKGFSGTTTLSSSVLVGAWFFRMLLLLFARPKVFNALLDVDGRPCCWMAKKVSGEASRGWSSESSSSLEIDDAGAFLCSFETISGSLSSCRSRDQEETCDVDILRDDDAGQRMCLMCIYF